MAIIRPYEPQHDEIQVYALWQQTFAHTWPVSLDIFRYVTVGNIAYQPGDHLVALSGNKIIGFIGYQVSMVRGVAEPLACLQVVLVASAYRKQGIGRDLHDHALDILKKRGVTEVQLGSGGPYYFWTGVPMNLPDAWTFFQACGWRERERSFDLISLLDNYATPAAIYERIRYPGISIILGSQEDMPAILEFEKQHFPNWLPFYRQVIESGGYADIVLARDAAHSIVGASFVIDGRTPRGEHDIRWKQLLGESTGGVGPLGVMEDVRENGIGLALAARVTELLHARGIKTSFVGYTWLVDWYGKLGYQIWQEYIMSRKQL